MRTRKPTKRHPGAVLSASGDTSGVFGVIKYRGSDPTDRGMLAVFFEGMETIDKHTLLKELDLRGYDLRTLRFSIKKKPSRRRGDRSATTVG